MASDIFKKHNDLPGAKKVFFVPIMTGEVELVDAFVEAGFEVYSINYENVNSRGKKKYRKINKKMVGQMFLKYCKDVRPDWVCLKIHHDYLPIDIIRQAKKSLPNTVFSNWTGDVRDGPRGQFAKIGEIIDVSFIVSTGQVDMYKSHGIKNVEFLPAPLRTSKFYTMPYPEKERLREELCHDISFCANNYTQYPGVKLRNEVVEKLSACFGNRFAVYGTGWKHYGESSRPPCEYSFQNEVYNGSKIAISINNYNDIEMYFSRRQLNAMASGTITISKYIPGLENFFENKKHLVWFNTADECLGLVRYYLEHEDEARVIGLAGAEIVKDEHNQYRWVMSMVERVKQYGL